MEVTSGAGGVAGVAHGPDPLARRQPAPWSDSRVELLEVAAVVPHPVIADQ
jgi:hypothetical protein